MKNIRNIKPNGLKGRDELERMKKLMGNLAPIKESSQNFKIERTKLGPDNVVYGIVRENQEFYIKTANKVKDLTLEDFQYIGGLKNKKKMAFPSYSSAMKKLNLKMISLNEQFGGERVNIFADDNLLNEAIEEEIVENDFVEEAVGETCTCDGDKDYCNASGGDCPVKDDATLDENKGAVAFGELKVDNVFQDGPKDMDGNSMGAFKDVDAEPDDAPNDSSVGTESEFSPKPKPSKTFESKKPISIMNAMSKMDSIIESLDLDLKKKV